MCWSQYTSDSIQGGATILAALVAVVAGVWGFFRQKEYELVQRRYLEEGLDVVISTTESALNTYYHNWARCLELLKSFRDLESIKPEDLDSGFLQLPPDRIALTANYRVNQIVNSPTVWRVFQLIVSFAQSGCSVTRDEIPLGLKVKLTTDHIAADRKEMVETAMNVLTELDEKSHRYHSFIGELQDISMLLEQKRFSFKGIRKLRKHPVVLAALKNLEEKFAADLKPNVNENP